MKHEPKICKYHKCGKEFIPSRGCQKYCCEECSKAAKREGNNRRAKERNKTAVAKQPTRKKESSLNDAIAAAKAMGVSYGQYQAMRQMGRV